MTGAAVNRSVARQLEQVTAERIDDCVQSLIAIVATTDPVELLAAVYWNMVLQFAGRDLDVTLQMDDVDSSLALQYLQNLVAAVPRHRVEGVVDPDAAAEQARLLVRELFETLSQHLWARGLNRLRDDEAAFTSLDLLENFSVRDWVHIRRSRFPRHDTRFLEAFLSPHDEVLANSFATTGAEVAKTLERLVNNHRYAPSVAVARLLGLSAQADTFMSLPDEQITRVSNTVLQLKAHPSLTRKCREAMGLDMFDVQRNGALPERLLEGLSWSPAEERHFLKPGQFRGWPLRVPPLSRRPLLKISSRYLCFNSDVLSTTIYRNIFELVRKETPAYVASHAWRARQTAASESFSAAWFRQMLPGAVLLEDYYIRDCDNPNAQPVQQDLLVIYDGVLIIVESKAGRFANMSPATDFGKYKRSLQELVCEPYTQSTRVSRRLELLGELSLLRREGAPKQWTYAEIMRLKKADFRVVITCGVMLESFPGPAARDAVLRTLAEGYEGTRFWPVSVEDLLPCADVFKSPLVFLNFLEWRTRQRPDQNVLVEEELDHVMRYLNGLRDPEDDIVAGNNLIVLGGTAAIARMYLHEESRDDVQARPPIEWLGIELKALIAHLDASPMAGRVRVSSVLLALSKRDKARLEGGLVESKHAIAVFGYRSFILFVDAALIVFSAPTIDPYLESEVARKTQLYASLRGFTCITAVILMYDRSGRLVDFRWLFLEVRLGLLVT
jgi:hypothetical protein